MERIDFVNSNRLIWCCEDFGISLYDLANETGVNLNTLNKVELEEPSLTYNQLKKISKFFGRDALFFLEEGEVNTNSVHSTQFRTLANQKPELSVKLRKIVELAEVQRDRFKDLLDELGDVDEIQFEPPQVSANEHLTEFADKVRTWLGLDDKNDFGTYRKALEKKGILVFQSNGYNGQWQIPAGSQILGFSLYDPHLPIILVRKLRFPTRQVFTLAHELGHILLHKVSNIDDMSDLESHQGIEQEANKFAGHFLLPDRFLDRIDIAEKPNNFSEYSDWLKTIKTQLGVSTDMVLRRLSDANHIGHSEYNNYRNWLSEQTFPETDGGTRTYRHREPQHIFGDRYVRKVFDAKNSRRITLTKVSKYLDNLKVADLHQLERHLADT